MQCVVCGVLFVVVGVCCRGLLLVVRSVCLIGVSYSWSLRVARCSFFVVWWRVLLLVCVVCCLLFATCYLVFVVCSLLLLFVVCCALHLSVAGCWLLFVDCCSLCARSCSLIVALRSLFGVSCCVVC